MALSVTGWPYAVCHPELPSGVPEPVTEMFVGTRVVALGSTKVAVFPQVRAQPSVTFAEQVRAHIGRPPTNLPPVMP